MMQYNNLDSNVHGANMGPIWGRQDSDGPHIDPMNFAICEDSTKNTILVNMGHGEAFVLKRGHAELGIVSLRKTSTISHLNGEVYYEILSISQNN